uniref:EF-hand domain-containing protein n=1 Tax=Trichobilharzia regenti TaxID=157069 RepID=A0AA85KM88_TRIRE|nr:unnamed protein product [Trichobilharzia regenti]
MVTRAEAEQLLKFLDKDNSDIFCESVSQTISENMGVDYLSILEKNFDTIDRNQNGWLNEKEIRDCLISFGFDPHYTEEFMMNFDTNKDGRVTKKEFLEAAKQMRAGKITEAEMRSAFKNADKNKSGRIDIYELKDFLKCRKNVVPMEVCSKWIIQNDRNGDGKLDYEEFLSFIRSML